MKTGIEIERRGYKVSPSTARLLDCIIASQSIYSEVYSIASELYGEDNEAIQKPLLDAFNEAQEQILRVMGGGIVNNLGTLSNLEKQLVEV